MRLSQILTEHIRSKDGQVVFSTPPKTPEGASCDFINTQLDNKLHPATGEDVGYEKVYSSYLYKSSDTNTSLLSSVKGQGPLAIDSQKLRAFIERTVAHVAPRLKSLVNPTVIIYPKSSSSFVRQVAEELGSKLGVKVLTDVLVKKKLELSGDRKLDLVKVEKAFINTDHPKYTTLPPESKRSLLSSVLSSVKKTGHVSSKGMDKKRAMFIKDFVKLGSQDEATKALGERVLLVDDVLSSGMTMRGMMSLLRKELEPEKMAGYTVFKLTSGSCPKENKSALP